MTRYADASWFVCVDCMYATGIPRNADNHEEDTGHYVVAEDDEE